MANNGSFAKMQAPVKVVHSNLDQEVIQITEDKLRLVLNEHIDHVESRKDWIAPLGVVITIITVFTTSNFKDAYLKAAVWEAVFFISGILSAFWFVMAAIRACRSPTVDEIVEKIKNRSEDENPDPTEGAS